MDGIKLETSERPKFAVLDDYPSVTENAELPAAELVRLSGLSKIMWYPVSHVPPDLRVFPPQLIVKPEKVRMVHDGSNPKYGLHGVPLNRRGLVHPGDGRQRGGCAVSVCAQGGRS